MFRLSGVRLEDVSSLTNRKIYRPGEPEPLWLHYAMEYDAIRRDLKAEQRAMRKAERMGFVARLRLALSRE